MADNELFDDLLHRQRKEQARLAARTPKTAQAVIGQLMTRRGYGRVQSTADFSEQWRQAAGAALARHSRPGRLRGGVLEVTVAGSAWLQELNFIKEDILARLAQVAPDQRVTDLRFKTGRLA